MTNQEQVKMYVLNYAMRKNAKEVDTALKCMSQPSKYHLAIL